MTEVLKLHDIVSFGKFRNDYRLWYTPILKMLTKIYLTITYWQNYIHKTYGNEIWQEVLR